MGTPPTHVLFQLENEDRSQDWDPNSKVHEVNAPQPFLFGPNYDRWLVASLLNLPFINVRTFLGTTTLISESARSEGNDGRGTNAGLV